MPTGFIFQQEGVPAYTGYLGQPATRTYR